MDFSSWLARSHLQTPAALLFGAFRPLAWFAGELLAAAAPLLPLEAEQTAELGKRLSDDGELDRLAAEWFGERA